MSENISNHLSTKPFKKAVKSTQPVDVWSKGFAELPFVAPGQSPLSGATQACQAGSMRELQGLVTAACALEPSCLSPNPCLDSCSNVTISKLPVVTGIDCSPFLFSVTWQ